MPRTQGLIPDRKRVNELAEYYRIMSNQIRDDLLMLDAETFKETKAISIQNKVDILTRRMNRFAIKWANESILEAYKIAMRIAQTSLDILGAKKDREFDNKIHSQAVKNGRDITVEFLVKANNSIKININTYVYLMRQASKDIMQIQAFDLRDEETIANLLDDTIKAGGSRQDLMRLIRIHFKRELYERKFININGRNYDLIKYAKMVSRTRLRKIQSEAVKKTCQQYENDLVEISDHGTITPICIPFEGNVYSLSGKTPGYPMLTDSPPYHPNCEHSMAPTSEAAIAVRSEYA